MNSEHLIKMANQIGDFFAAMPDSEQAKKDIANHILKSWEPRMRQNLLSHIDEHGDEKLKPMLREALTLIRGA
jgi:formate dehydrogenase subunit delta